MTSSPAPLLLFAAAVALAACEPSPAQEADAGSSRGLRIEAHDAAIPRAPLRGKLETMAPRPQGVAVAAAAIVPPTASDAAPAADEAIHAVGPAIPQGRAPGGAPYDPFPGGPPPAGAAPAPEQPGFRITLPLCRNAERLNDPLAQTPECAALLQAGAEQQRLCARAFEDGDDAVVLSPACRQAARAR